jgi:hypothetical protein
VDSSAIEEVKETSDGAHLTAGGSSNRRSEDFPMEIDSGQMQISLWAYQGLTAATHAGDAPCLVYCFCVGAPLGR